jgi:hypothetical protein
MTMKHGTFYMIEAWSRSWGRTPTRRMILALVEAPFDTRPDMRQPWDELPMLAVPRSDQGRMRVRVWPAAVRAAAERGALP